MRQNFDLPVKLITVGTLLYPVGYILFISTLFGVILFTEALTTNDRYVSPVALPFFISYLGGVLGAIGLFLSLFSYQKRLTIFLLACGIFPYGLFVVIPMLEGYNLVRATWSLLPLIIAARYIYLSRENIKKQKTSNDFRTCAIRKIKTLILYIFVILIAFFSCDLYLMHKPKIKIVNNSSSPVDIIILERGTEVDEIRINSNASKVIYVELNHHQVCLNDGRCSHHIKFTCRGFGGCSPSELSETVWVSDLKQAAANR